jgi:hypothetical protein
MHFKKYKSLGMSRFIDHKQLLYDIEKAFASLPESDIKLTDRVKTEDEQQPHTALEISSTTKANENRVHKVIRLKQLYKDKRYLAFIAPIFEYDTYSTFEEIIDDIHNNWICKREIVSFKVVNHS